MKSSAAAFWVVAEDLKRKEYRIITVLLAAFLCTAATGCAEKRVDYSIDDTESTGQAEEVDQTLTSVDAPSTYEISIPTESSEIGTITIRDEKVNQPDTVYMVREKYNKKIYNSDARKQTATAVFDDQTQIFEQDASTETKEDIGLQIADLERRKDLGDGTNTLDAELSDLQGAQKTAPAQTEASAYTEDMYVGSRDGIKYQLICPGENAGCGYMLDIYGSYLDVRPGAHAEKSVSCSVFPRSSYSWYQRIANRSADTTDADISENNESSYTPEEAAKIAGEFLKEVGVTDVSQCYISDLCFEYQGVDRDVLATDMDGYVVTFIKTIDDCPVASMNLMGVGNIPDLSENGLSYMTCTVYVSSSGILKAEWSDMLVPSDETESVTLLTFDEMIEQAKTTIPAYYETYPSVGSLSFNDVTLSYFPEPDKDTGEFVFAPVWIFSQCSEDNIASGNDLPSQIVVIDAVDGHAVDLSELSTKLQVETE